MPSHPLPPPPVPTNSTFSLPGQSTAHTVLEFTLLNPCLMMITPVPRLCVILALGTQEAFNAHLLTKSRLKVIQDIIQTLFHLNCWVHIVETEINNTHTCGENPSAKSHHRRRKLKTGSPDRLVSSSSAPTPDPSQNLFFQFCCYRLVSAVFILATMQRYFFICEDFSSCRFVIKVSSFIHRPFISS